jgi:hypothetical protein
VSVRRSNDLIYFRKIHILLNTFQPFLTCVFDLVNVEITSYCFFEGRIFEQLLIYFQKLKFDEINDSWLILPCHYTPLPLPRTLLALSNQMV